MAKAVIIAALPCKLAVELAADDLVIACDKGYERAKAAGLSPDVIIGDFDSLGFVPSGENVIKLPVRKDDTDTGYAIKFAIERGFSDISVYGALGGLTDHTFAAVQLAAGASRQGISLTFFADDCVLFALTNGKRTFSADGKRFSVFAVDNCGGVGLSGADFELKGADLSPFFPLGVSNKGKGETEIEVASGTLAVLYYL